MHTLHKYLSVVTFVGLTKGKSKEIPPSMFTGASYAISFETPQVQSPAYPIVFSRTIICMKFFPNSV